MLLRGLAAAPPQAVAVNVLLLQLATCDMQIIS
jgi:hypothetical protein